MLAFSSRLLAQNEIPDSLFGTNSLLIYPTPVGEEGVQLLQQSDGKILYGGYDYDGSLNAYLIDIIRFDVCGRIDSSYGTNGLVRYTFEQRNMANAFAIQTDDKIVVAGMQAPSNAGSQQISAVSRFKTDGTPDSSFNGNGSNALRYDPVSSGQFYSVDILPDGRILCIGNCSGNINGGVSAMGLMRFMSDGSLDTSFSSDGKAIFNGTTSPFYGKTIGHLLDDKSAIVTSYGFDGSFLEHFVAIHVDSSGNLDSTFATNGYYWDTTLVISNSYASSSLVDASGNIVFAAKNNDNLNLTLVKLDPDGNPDPLFGVNGHLNIPLTNFEVLGMQLMQNGNYFIKGGLLIGNWVGFGIMLHPDGSPDTAFGANGLRVFDLLGGLGGHKLNSLLELPNGEWMIGSGNADFIVRKYGDTNNVPHISVDGSNLITTGGINYQWYLDSVPIALATDSMYPISLNGSYTVEVTDAEGCTYLSDPFIVVNAGFSAINNKEISVYPNPAKSVIRIELNQNKYIDEIQVTDLTGKLMNKYNIHDAIQRWELPVEYLHSGIYIMTVISQDGTYSTRFTKY